MNLIRSVITILKFINNMKLKIVWGNSLREIKYSHATSCVTRARRAQMRQTHLGNVN